MKDYGFTTFLDLSHDEEFFSTVKNEDLPNPFPNIKERTGIITRQRAHEDVGIVGVMRHGVRTIMSELDIKGKDCAGLVVSSVNPANQESLDTLARYIASEVGIGKFQGINFACSGFAASIEAAKEMENAKNKHILTITAEIASALVDWDDENTAVVFADGLAATSIIPGGRHVIHHAEAVGNIPDPEECLRLVDTKGARTIYDQYVEEARPVITMGKHGGKQLYRTVPKRFLSLIEESPFNLDGINHIVSHQANGKFAKKMKDSLPEDSPIQIIDTMSDQGNIVSASIPVALAKTIGSFDIGDMVACPAKGAGENFVRGTLSEGLLVFEVGA